MMLPPGLIAILGDVCLMLSCSMSLLQMASLFRRDSVKMQAILLPAALVQAISAMASLLLLIIAFALSDFSVATVFFNSHSAKPLLYKITGSWGNHEGSMLLWAVVLSGLGFIAARRGRPIDYAMLGAQGFVASGIYVFILATSSPFTQLIPTPSEGQGLNPLLQDIGLAIHPPLLYLGYVGFGIVFAYALAGMRRGMSVNEEWARAVHPWIALSWAMLTFGIGLGSWWAYRELGWGGFWFWDPVENVALLPWLSGTALLHSNRCLMRRGQLASWTLLLAIITFSLSLIGTFIVRSGLLTSVHSFATDPARGIFILCYIALVSGSALWCYARRELPHSPIAIQSREGLILLNNLFLMVATATILLAIIYPLILQAIGQPSISIGAPYFNQTFFPLTAPLLFLAALGMFCPWGAISWPRLGRAARLPALLSAIAALLVYAGTEHERLLTIIGVALGIWLVATSINEAAGHIRRNRHVPRSAFPMLLGHFALGGFALALTFASLHSNQISFTGQKGDIIEMEGLRFSITADAMRREENYASRKVSVRVGDRVGDIATLSPEIRYYPEREMQTIEAAVASGLLNDIYMTVTLIPQSDKLAFTYRENPAMIWLWFSWILMGFSGITAAFAALNNR